jgi:hypothetical protein
MLLEATHKTLTLADIAAAQNMVASHIFLLGTRLLLLLLLLRTVILHIH